MILLCFNMRSKQSNFVWTNGFSNNYNNNKISKERRLLIAYADEIGGIPIAILIFKLYINMKITMTIQNLW